MRLATALTPLFLAAGGFSLHSADVRLIEISKSVDYAQNATGGPVVRPNAYEFRARVELTKQQSVSSVTVKWPFPVNTTRSLTNYGTYWEYSQRYAGIETMNFANPNGSYLVTLEGVTDGRRINNLLLSFDLYPNPPQIANYLPGQAVSAKNDFTLQWNSLGGNANDITRIRVFSGNDVVFETGNVPGAAGTLNGLATSVLIPKNTLSDGSVYRAQVIASRRSATDTMGYAGVPAMAIYRRMTEIPLRTVYGTLDVNWFGVAKVRRFSQNSALAPAAVTPGGYGFNAFAVATDPLNVKNASVKLPNGAVKTLSAAGSAWNWSESFDAQGSMDASYTAGTYELQLQTTHNGSQKLSLPMAAPVFSPPIQISNWNEASAIDSSKPFTLRWVPIANAVADDFIQVIVKKAGQIVFRSAEYPKAIGALDGRASSFNLPAGLLSAGEAAEVTLMFSKAATLDPFSYPQAVGTVSCGCETRATIRARSMAVPAAVLSTVQARNGVLEFNITGTPDRLQVIQMSSDLRGWSDIFFTNAPATSYVLRLPVNTAQRVAAFRILSN